MPNKVIKLKINFTIVVLANLKQGDTIFNFHKMKHSGKMLKILLYSYKGLHYFWSFHDLFRKAIRNLRLMKVFAD